MKKIFFIAVVFSLFFVSCASTGNSKNDEELKYFDEKIIYETGEDQFVWFENNDITLNKLFEQEHEKIQGMGIIYENIFESDAIPSFSGRINEILLDLYSKYPGVAKNKTVFVIKTKGQDWGWNQNPGVWFLVVGKGTLGPDQGSCKVSTKQCLFRTKEFNQLYSGGSEK